MRHAGYGLKMEYLYVAEKVLILTLKDALGQVLTKEVEFAWTMVYSFMTATMSCGLRVHSEIEKITPFWMGQDLRLLHPLSPLCLLRELPQQLQALSMLLRPHSWSWDSRLRVGGKSTALNATCRRPFLVMYTQQLGLALAAALL
jgi:hypothetical protein